MKREANVFILLSIIVLLLSILFHSAIAGWSPMESGSTDLLNGIWGSSPTDVFAVGTNGTILHYDGDGDNDGVPDTMWERMSSGIERSLNDVWGSSDTDVYAVGSTILHYDGNDWSEIYRGMDRSFTCVWGSASNDVFVAGSNGVLHYDGSNWSEMENASGSHLRNIWGNSPTSVFAVGSDDIIHYNGNSWNSMFEFPTTTTTMWGGYGFSYCDIWGSSGANVYATTNYGEIYHYNGSSWALAFRATTTTSPYVFETFYFSGIWGSSETDIFAVGGYYPSYHSENYGKDYGIIFHYDGFTWSEMDIRATGMRRLNGVWGASSSNVFAVGESHDVNILHYDGSTSITTTITACPAHNVYGVHSGESELLRYFRDEILNQTPEGQELIRLYYQWSPAIVKAMDEDEGFKQEIKGIIDNILPMIEKEVE